MLDKLQHRIKPAFILYMYTKGAFKIFTLWGIVMRLYAGIDLNPILATALRPCCINSCVYCEPTFSLAVSSDSIQPSHAHAHTHTHTHTSLQIQSLWWCDQLCTQEWMCNVLCTQHHSVYREPSSTGGGWDVLNSILLSQGLGRFLTGAAEISIVSLCVCV